MLEELKTMLGDAAAAYTDAQIEIAYRQAQEEAAAYCRRALDADLLLIAQKMAIYRLNRTATPPTFLWCLTAKERWSLYDI